MSEGDAPDAFDGETLHLAVPDSLAGMRVDRAVSMLTDRSRAEASAAIEEGRVEVNGHIVTKSSRPLAEGEVLHARLRPRVGEGVEPESDVDVAVVLEGDDFVVVDKSPHQVVHPGAGQRRGTLVAGLLARYPQIAELAQGDDRDPARPGIVHRLDRGTSGLLVVATTPTGLASLSAQIAAREVERTYVSLVAGHVAEERGVVDAPIGRSTRSPILMAVRSDGRAARTHYDVLARLDEPYPTSMARLRLETGRTHQIRVHMASIGHAVVNDLRYGHRRDPRLDEDRLFLHASRLAFRDPGSGETVAVASPLPGDLSALLPEGLEL